MNKSNLAILTMVVAILFGVVMYFLKAEQDQSAAKVVTVKPQKPKSKISIPEDATQYKISSGTVSYVATKEFLKKLPEEVTGTSNQVSGNGWFDPVRKDGYIEVYIDINTIATDTKKRDEDVVKMFSDPNVRFTANISNLDMSTSGQFTSNINGSLTLNGITKEAIFIVDGTVDGTTLVADGTTLVKMSDFGLKPPSLVNISTARDELKLNFEIKGERVE